MTTATETRIWQDTALVIDPKHLGIAASGRELEKLFVDFCNRNSENTWQFELSPSRMLKWGVVWWARSDQRPSKHGLLSNSLAGRAG